MNNVLGQVLIWTTVLATGAAGVASVLVIWRLWRWRDEDYRKKYLEFLKRKSKGETDHEDKHFDQ